MLILISHVSWWILFTKTGLAFLSGCCAPACLWVFAPAAPSTWSILPNLLPSELTHILQSHLEHHFLRNVICTPPHLPSLHQSFLSMSSQHTGLLFHSTFYSYNYLIICVIIVELYLLLWIISSMRSDITICFFHHLLCLQDLVWVIASSRCSINIK